MTDWLTITAYRLGIWLAPLLPERFGYWLAARIGDLAYYFRSQARHNFELNLKHVLDLQNSIKNYFDLFRGHQLSAAQVYEQLESVEGLTSLDTALAQGKGLVGGTAHFGNFNMFLHLTAVHLNRTHEIIVPIERIKPAAVFDLVREQRAVQGIQIVPVDTAGRLLLRKLKQGAVVGLAVDLDVTRSGQYVDFFGSPARMPDGAAALAIKYDVPLVLGFIRRLENNKCAVVIEPVAFERTDDRAKDTTRAVEKIIGRLEDWIRRYPEQWLFFQPAWEGDK
jgi:KDO2-lipid IV(A) lauroyltransferase